MKAFRQIDAPVDATADKQISLTDFAARSMKRRGTSIVGHNVQTAVDARHRPIMAHEVTNIGIDWDQLIATANWRVPQWDRKISR